MDKLSLRTIDEHNFLEAFDLKLEKEQEKFTSSPTRSLAQAYVYRNQCIPFGIYKEKIMIGYVLILYDYDLEEYNIWHFMIDHSYQGKGYGKQALSKCLEYIKTRPFGTSNKIVITCDMENVNALHLYKEYGFRETKNIFEDEFELELFL